MADVAYKNNTYNGKVEGKKVMSFGAGKDAFAILATAQSGDTFDVTVVKNDKGYNDWVSMQKAGAVQTGGVGSSVPGAVSGSNARGATTTPNRGFETPEERARRQVLIVRQSSISAAISALTPGAKGPLKPSDVIAHAKEYEAYVLSTGGGDTGFDDVPDLDPSFNNPVVE